jgi:hypothetical protein
MANTFLTPSVFAQEGLMILENELVLGNKVRADYSDTFAMVGDTINIRRQTAFSGQADNLDLSSFTEDVTEGKTTISMNKTLSTKVNIGVLDRTLSFDRVSQEVIRPVMVKFKDYIEQQIAAQYTSFYHFDGTPGTVPATYLSLATPNAIMTDVGIPNSDRFAVHSPTASATLADSLKGSFVAQKAKTAFEKSMIGPYGGFDNHESVHVPTHTVGPLGGTPLVNGGAQAVTYATAKDTWSQTFITDGWTAAAAARLKAGDIFTVPNVFSVNPVSRVSTGRLQTFVVMADVSSDASGNLTATISPPIITSGAYQTVTAAPADNVALTIKTGTASTAYRQSLILHPDAIALVTRPLRIEQGSGVKTSTKSGNRVSISCTEWVDGNTLAHYMRFDMLFGVKAIDPRLGLRLTN